MSWAQGSMRFWSIRMIQSMGSEVSFLLQGLWWLNEVITLRALSPRLAWSKCTGNVTHHDGQFPSLSNNEFIGPLNVAFPLCPIHLCFEGLTAAPDTENDPDLPYLLPTSLILVLSWLTPWDLISVSGPVCLVITRASQSLLLMSFAWPSHPAILAPQVLIFNHDPGWEKFSPLTLM